MRHARAALLMAAVLLGGLANASQAADVKNGEYLFHAGGCVSCHAAPASDKCDDPKYKEPLKLVGGRCLKTPFGTFNVPNITQDRQTGIGGWSDEDFINAMTKGTAPDGSNYYPAFPYASYQRMARADLLDLKAYLNTLEAAPSQVPGHDLSFPYNIRWGLGFWKWLYLDEKPFAPDPAKSDAINRGAYLVNGPGHCGECHSPRTWMGGMIEASKLSGAPNPEGKGRISNITPHATGIGSWSEKDIIYALETGFTPEGDVMGGAMAKVQENMAKLSAEDRAAIAAYLKSIPAIASEPPAK